MYCVVNAKHDFKHFNLEKKINGGVKTMYKLAEAPHFFILFYLCVSVKDKFVSKHRSGTMLW